MLPQARLIHEHTAAMLRLSICILVIHLTTALSPQGVLAEWQAARVRSLDVDHTRYHAQVLFVDDDNARARMAECCADTLAHWADAGW